MVLDFFPDALNETLEIPVRLRLVTRAITEPPRLWRVSWEELRLWVVSADPVVLEQLTIANIEMCNANFAFLRPIHNQKPPPVLVLKGGCVLCLRKPARIASSRQPRLTP